MFEEIKKLVADKAAWMQANGPLLVADVDRDLIWQTYLNAFPEEIRQEHNCNCCKAFIRQYGNTLVYDRTTLLPISVWDVELPDGHEYKASCEALSAYVKACNINNPFFTDMGAIGTDKNLDKVREVVWKHYHTPIDKAYKVHADQVPARVAQKRENKELLIRALNEIKTDAVETVLELIAQNSLYRGKEYEKNLQGLLKVKKQWEETDQSRIMGFAWIMSHELPETICRIRNQAIGQLLISLSEGDELEKAVASFEKMMAPANYKRPTALVTPRMIEQAKEKLTELGLLGALERRKLDNRDLTAKHALYVFRPKKATKDVFDVLKDETKVETQTLDKVEEVPVKDFIEKILPLAKQVRMLFEGSHLGNLVTLTGPVNEDEKPIMKWDNSFGWSYTGGMADGSLREQVRAAGGRVDGVLRFSHSWNHDGQNQSLMDLHVALPGCPAPGNGYGNAERVGWNMRSHVKTKGVQDVDFVNAPGKAVPVENITFPEMRLLPEGRYLFRIHNWQARNPNKSGFKAEIELNGEVYTYEHPKPLKHHEWVTVATANLKNGHFDIKHHIKPGSGNGVTKWGITTGTWQEVMAVTKSPNHWDTAVGNLHLFFILRGCVSDETTRPFYNEFLCQELEANRKVMEVLGGKIQVADAERQELSGLGFSDTKRAHAFFEVEGKFKRIIKVLF
jgi:hypothetical protein